MPAPYQSHTTRPYPTSRTYRQNAGAQFGPTATPVSRAMEAIQTGRPPPAMTPGQRAALVAVLRGWGVRTVLVGPMGHQAAMVAFFTALLGRPPTPVGGVFAWWDTNRAVTPPDGSTAGVGRQANRSRQATPATRQ